MHTLVKVTHTANCRGGFHSEQKIKRLNTKICHTHTIDHVNHLPDVASISSLTPRIKEPASYNGATRFSEKNLKVYHALDLRVIECVGD